MKKVFRLLTIFILVISFMLAHRLQPIKVMANTINDNTSEITTELEQNETDLAYKFEKEILPLILQYLISFGGTITSLVILFKKIRDFKNDIKNNNEKNNSTIEKVNELLEENQLKNKELANKFEINIEKINKYIELTTPLLTEQQRQAVELDKIKEILVLMASNSAELVRLGATEHIVKVADINGKK